MRFKRTKERERTLHRKKSGNLTISVRNEAGGLFGAKVSRTLWVVGVWLCGIGKVVERKKALKCEEKRKVKKVEEVINLLPLGVGRLWDKREGWRESRGKLPFKPGLKHITSHIAKFAFHVHNVHLMTRTLNCIAFIIGQQ